MHTAQLLCSATARTATFNRLTNSPENVHDFQARRGLRLAHGESSQQAHLSSSSRAPTEIDDGRAALEIHEGPFAHGISARGSPDIGMKDTTGGELSGPESSLCPPSSPSRATTIPDGCNDDAAVGNDQVGTSQPYPDGHFAAVHWRMFCLLKAFQTVLMGLS